MQSLANPYVSAECRLELRRLKGRDQRGGTTTQWDVTQQRFRKPTIAPDPMFDLFVARQNAWRGPANAERYGALRQTVVSPLNVRLPA
jgi:hypothetical protein